MNESPEHTGDQPALLVHNEFATVLLTVSHNAHMLEVKDVRTGRAIVLDPLELESLTRLTRSDTARLVDPSAPRVADQDGEAWELVPGEGEEPDFSNV